MMLPICAAVLRCALGPAQETCGWVLPAFFPRHVFILSFKPCVSLVVPQLCVQM